MATRSTSGIRSDQVDRQTDASEIDRSKTPSANTLEDAVVTGSQASGCNMDMLAFGQGGYYSIVGLLVVDTREPSEGVTSQSFLVDLPECER